MATSVGVLTIEMAANIARLQKDMDSAKRSVDGAMSQIKKSAEMATKALGAIGVGLSITGIANMVKNAINLGDAMSDLSQRTGVAVKDIAGLQMAFKYGGASAGAFESAMSRLSMGIVNGNKALEAMGIQAQNADGSMKSTRQVLGEVADRFASYEDGARKTALAIEIFGKSGAELLPVLNGGADGLAKFDAMAQKLGLTLDTETADAMGEFNDTIDLIKDSFTGMFTQIAVQILPSLQAMAEAFFTLVSEGEMLKIVSKAIVTVFQTVAVVGSDVLFVLRQIGLGFIALKDAAAEALTGNLSGARKVFEDYNKQAEEARASLDKFQATVMGTGETTVGAMAKATSAMKKAAVSAKELEEAQKKAAEEMAAAAKRNNEEFDKYFDSIEKVRLAQENGIKKAREMVENIEFEAEALKMTNEEREIAIKLRELERNGLEKNSRAYEEMAKRIREAMVGKQAIEAAIAEQKRLEAELKKTNDQLQADFQKTSDIINKSLTDALMQAFEDGKGFAASFKDTLVNMFKTMVLRPVIQAIVQPLGGAVSAALGSLGLVLPGTASAAGASSGSSVFSALSLAGSAFGTGLGAGFSSILAAGVGGWATAAGSLIATGTLSGIAAGAGMLAGPIGLAVFAASKIFGSKSKEAGSGAFVTSRGLEPTRELAGFAFGMPAGNSAISDLFNRFNAQIKPVAQSIVDSVVDATQNKARVLGKEIAIGIDAGLAWDPKDVKTYGYAGIFIDGKKVATYANRELGDTFEKGVQKFAEELTEKTSRKILKSLGVIVKESESASEKLDYLAQSISIVNVAFNNLGFNLFEISGAGAQAAAAFVDLMGGMDSFIETTKFYYENFYTEAERIANTTKQVQDAMSSLGLEMPATREAFRQLVEQAKSAGDQQLLANLLKLSPAFASISAAVGDAGNAFQGAAVQMRTAAQIAQERYQLETRLLQLQGDTATLREREIAELDASNVELMKQIYALQDAQAAQAAAMQKQAERERQMAAAEAAAQSAAAERQRIQQEQEAKLQAILNERLGLERQILVLLGDTATIRKLELEALDPSNRALQLRIWAIEDERAAQEELARQQERFNNERLGLEKQILQIQGNTARLREMELEALDPSNRALQIQIWALQDAKKAQEEYTRTLETTTKSIADEIERLRGGTNRPSLSVLQAQFAIATAQARAGDMMAAQNLPALSRSIADLVASTAGSSLDVIRSNARLAASLSDTLSALNYSPIGGVQSGMGDLESGTAGGEIAYSTSMVTAQADTAGEVRALREENRAQAATIARLLSSMNRITERWDRDGLPGERIEA
jgi:hypothetical protein